MLSLPTAFPYHLKTNFTPPNTIHCKKSGCFFSSSWTWRSTFPFPPFLSFNYSFHIIFYLHLTTNSFLFFLPLTDFDSLYSKSVSMVVISAKNKNNVKLITITTSTNCENNYKISYVCSILNHLRLKYTLFCSRFIYMTTKILFFFSFSI